MLLLELVSDCGAVSFPSRTLDSGLRSMMMNVIAGIDLGMGRRMLGTISQTAGKAVVSTRVRCCDCEYRS